jgi:hypothetical protein
VGVRFHGLAQRLLCWIWRLYNAMPAGGQAAAIDRFAGREHDVGQRRHLSAVRLS